MVVTMGIDAAVVIVQFGEDGGAPEDEKLLLPLRALGSLVLEVFQIS